MQKYTICLLLSFGCWLQVVAQNGAPPPAGARGIAMGNTGTAHTGIYSLFSNQAGLADITQTEIAVFGEQRFFLSELSILQAGVAVPVGAGVFGLQVQQFGFDQYTEQKIGLTYARKLANKFSLGGQIDVLHTRISEYGSQTVVTFELGFQAALLRNLTWSAHVFSPLKVEVSDDYSLPSVLSVGLNYQGSEKLEVIVEMEKDIDHPVVVKGGIEYQATPSFALRVGAAVNPALVSMGIGYTKKQIRIDVASAYHPSLGFMPGISASYRLGKS